MKYLTSALALILILGVGTPALAKEKNSSISKDNLMLAIKVANETNQARVEAGLLSLEFDTNLYLTAYEKALKMAELHEYSHVLSDGVTLDKLLQNHGVMYYAGGENLAFGFDTAPSVVKAWLASPTHAANIKNRNYNKIGVAALPMTYDGQSGLVFVQLFVGD